MAMLRAIGWIGLLGPCVLLLPGGGSAQTVPPETSPEALEVVEPQQPALSVEQVETRLKDLDTAAGLDDSTLNEARQLYQSALQHLELAAQRRKEEAQFEQLLASAPDKLDAALKRQKVAGAEIKAIELPPDATLKQVIDEFSAREARLKQLTEVLTQLDAEPKRRAARLEEIAAQHSATRQQLEAVEQQLTSLGPETAEGDPLLRARRTELRARRELLQNTLRSLDAEGAAYQGTTELIQVQRDVAAVDVARAEAVTKKWQELVNELRQREVQQQASEAQRREESAKRLSPQLQQLAKDISRLAEERRDVAQRIESASTELAQRRELLNQVVMDHQRAKEKVSAVGLSHESGQILRQKRASLPDLRQYRRSIAAREISLRNVKFEAYRYNDQRLDLADLETASEKLTAQMRQAALAEGEPAASASEIRTADVRALLEPQKEYLTSLISDYERLTQLFLQLNETEKQLIEVTQQLQAFIDERVLWIRSTHAPDWRVAGPTWDAFRWLCSAQNWQSVGAALRRDWQENFWLLIPCAIVFLGFWYLQKPLRRTLGKVAQAASRRSCSEFLPTMRALGITFAISILWPGILAFSGWRLFASLESEFGLALAYAARAVSLTWLPLEWLRQVCRRNGLAACHFDWPAALITQIRRSVRMINVVGLPLLFVALVFEHQKQALWSSSLGRFCFMGFLAVCAVFVDRLIRSPEGIVRQYLHRFPEHWLFRLRWLWASAALLAPLAMIVITFIGYYDTAQKLSVRLFASACLLTALVVLNSLLSRWILVRRRALAMEQARQRRAALQAEGSPITGSVSEASETVVLTEDKLEEVDLGRVSQQTVQLLRTFVLFLGLAGLWYIFAEVIPALNLLRQYPAWPGATTMSLADLLLGIALLAITYIATKNVPGLLELTLLNYLPVDAGARFATKTICRYLIAALGLFAAGQALHVPWKSFQWLVAAMGIGLGFGLQEIFANFVSGLILLFERPIRVGDIITLADTTGTVSQIRMRATTIIDWDRKELIVPNKDLITGRLLNWTLTNQINRVVINVGIAYGSDTERARNLLLRLAENHSLIMDDPAPMATFEGFGDSTLNLVLRCYLPNLENRLAVVHELHSRIAQEFAREGLEIAFPQRDLHLYPSQELLDRLGPSRNSESTVSPALPSRS